MPIAMQEGSPFMLFLLWSAIRYADNGLTQVKQGNRKEGTSTFWPILALLRRGSGYEQCSLTPNICRLCTECVRVSPSWSFNPTKSGPTISSCCLLDIGWASPRNAFLSSSEIKDQPISVCGAGRFLCGKSGECVDGEKRCDGERNCPHGEDEILCRQGTDRNNEEW